MTDLIHFIKKNSVYMKTSQKTYCLTKTSPIVTENLNKLLARFFLAMLVLLHGTKKIV